MIRILTRVMLVVAVLSVVGLVTAADSGRARSFFLWVGSIPGGDKVGHFIVFGLLAFLANAAVGGTRFRIGRLALLKGSVVVFVPAALEEFSQLFVITRSFDLLDLLADGIGILFGGWLAVVVLRQAAAWSSRVKAAKLSDTAVATMPLPEK